MHRNLKMFYITAVLVCSMLLAGCDNEEEALFQEISEEELDEKGSSSEAVVDEYETGNPEMIFVHVCGAVKHPGVYELESGSRIYEAIAAAGGIAKNAAEDFINQAEVLSDGQQLYVPSWEEIENQNMQTGMAEDGKININKASKEELMTLSGVGEAKADAIIRYREEHSGFKSIEEIMEIEGIKEGVFRKIEDDITVS